VSTDERAGSIVEPVRAIVREINPNLAVFGIKKMDAVVEDSLADFTVYLWLIAAAAVLALVLASTGTYAVISHVTAARTREFAIRAAIGADRLTILRLVVGQGLWLASAGLGLGLFGAWAGGRLLESLPVTVREPDGVTLIPTALLMALVVIAASLVPARRAAVTDPIAALRSE
jgi:ABC-type antimicrobial peptide transport system permease subunit